MPPETPPGDAVSTIRLVPYETRVTGSGKIEYQLHAFDGNGRFLKQLSPALQAGVELADADVDGNELVFSSVSREQAGELVARHHGLSAKARLRAFPELPWEWDFEGFADKQLPPTWIGAAGKLAPAEIDGSMVIKETVGRGRPSTYIWIGPPDMQGYTIRADVMMREETRRLPSIGITAQRYNLILKGNVSKLAVQSWAPHLRMAKEIRFRSDPDVWYTMKLKVDIQEDGAHVLGRVWKRDDAEPESWTIEAVDPHANQNGSPGLYLYALADCYFDNVRVTKE
jgi:hypothetical protein